MRGEGSWEGEEDMDLQNLKGKLVSYFFLIDYSNIINLYLNQILVADEQKNYIYKSNYINIFL